jgi:hypothetical protein
MANSARPQKVCERSMTEWLQVLFQLQLMTRQKEIDG